jgi:chaperonin cofactor prefoldin
MTTPTNYEGHYFWFEISGGTEQGLSRGGYSSAEACLTDVDPVILSEDKYDKLPDFIKIMVPLFHNRVRKVCVLVATLILPALAYAQESSATAAPQAQIDSLRTTVASLQSQVSSLQKTNTTLQSEVTALQNELTAARSVLAQVNSLQSSNTTLQSEVTALQHELTAARPVLALAPYVSVDPNAEIGVIGPNIVFSGVNIHIVSGSGSTDDNLSKGESLTGLGNLIIGYNEDPGDPALRFSGTSLGPGDRGGSHNLVIGRGHTFTKAAFGGLVVGEVNKISNSEASILGGGNNIASGVASVVVGGIGNAASGVASSILGGTYNSVGTDWGHYP